MSETGPQFDQYGDFSVKEPKDDSEKLKFDMYGNEEEDLAKKEVKEPNE